MEKGKEKNEYLQAIRGLAIIIVVFIHCKNAANYPVGGIEYGINFVLRQITNFPVALFIFLSGYFALSNEKINIKRKLSRIVVPYIIWTTIYILWNFLIKGT